MAGMSVASRSRWDQRRLISVGLLLSGLALPVTGLGDHLARDTSGPLPDSSWIVAHVAVGVLFVLFAAWHAVLNRSVLVRYLGGRLTWTATEPRSPGCAGSGGPSTSTRNHVLRSRRARRVESPFVTLDRSRCQACWECIAVCPELVISKIDIRLHRHAVIKAGDRCTGCRRCVKVCGPGALSDRADDGQTRSPRSVIESSSGASQPPTSSSGTSGCSSAGSPRPPARGSAPW
jgi:Pyruvate/2-oxoacid:ferredoxin oxidoreductase delta subunit